MSGSCFTLYRSIRMSSRVFHEGDARVWSFLAANERGRDRYRVRYERFRVAAKRHPATSHRRVEGSAASLFAGANVPVQGDRGRSRRKRTRVGCQVITGWACHISPLASMALRMVSSLRRHAITRTRSGLLSPGPREATRNDPDLQLRQEDGPLPRCVAGGDIIGHPARERLLLAAPCKCSELRVWDCQRGTGWLWCRHDRSLSCHPR